MTYEYFAEDDSIFIHLTDNKVDTTMDQLPFIFHLDANDDLVMLEILQISEITQGLVDTILSSKTIAKSTTTVKAVNLN